MTLEVSAALPFSPELRTDSRQDLDVPGRLLAHDAIPRHIRITDISPGGIGLVASEALQIGDTCAIAFDATVNKESRRINVWTKVTYCASRGGDSFRIGVYFRDYDSHSRMLIAQLCRSTGLSASY